MIVIIRGSFYFMPYGLLHFHYVDRIKKKKKKRSLGESVILGGGKVINCHATSSGGYSYFHDCEGYADY